jgi:hypothetical protein
MVPDTTGGRAVGFLHTRLVSFDEWRAANKETGSVYFIRDDQADQIKIGHAKSPLDRMAVLQVGSANQLRMIGIVAAPRVLESRVHDQFRDGHAHGEWFFDREIVSAWLRDITYGEPICRNIWRLVPGRPFVRTEEAAQ